MAGIMVSTSTGVMNSLLGKLATLMGEEFAKLKNLRKEVKYISDELSSMKDALESLADLDELDKQTARWRDAVREMSYDIEDIIDDFMCKIGEKSKKSGFVHDIIQRLRTSRARHQIAGQIEDIKKLVHETSARRERYKVDVPTSRSVAVNQRVVALYENAAKLVGMEGPTNELVSWLKDEEKQLKVVSIVGFGGLGKTTLANQVLLRRTCNPPENSALRLTDRSTHTNPAPPTSDTQWALPRPTAPPPPRGSTRAWRATTLFCSDSVLPCLQLHFKPHPHRTPRDRRRRHRRMPMAAPQPRRHQAAFLRSKPPAPANGKPDAASSKPKSPASPAQAPPPSSLEERTVKQLRLAKALTLPEATAVSEACRRMAARRADAALLTDAKGILSGIVTAEDISGRVIAEGLMPDGTTVAKVMTRNPVFVMSNSSATEALQKMVQGKFRHLPVVEHGEVIAMLDITKFLCDAISRMEKAAEQGSAIAAAMEGVERQWGNEFAGPHTLIENLRDHMFKPSLSTIIPENSSVPSVSSSDLVTVAAKKMREYRVNSVVVMTGNMLQGILTSKDLVLRVVAQGLSPEVMTASPDCATLDTSILEALQSMQDRKYRHILVADKRGQIVACLDALQLTHTAISMVEGASGPNYVANTMVQKFWDSALALHPAEESNWHSAVTNLVRQPQRVLKGSKHPLILSMHSLSNLKTEKGECTDSVVFQKA